MLWPPDAMSWLTGKDPDAGKDGGQEEKGVTEDEVVGWHHQLNGLKFRQTQRDSKGQESLGSQSVGAKCQIGLSDRRTTFHCWWEEKLTQPLWRTVQRFLKN